MIIKGIVIPVTDQDRAVKFYTEKLGFTVKLDMPMQGGECGDQRWIELSHPSTAVEVCLFTSPDFKDMIGKNMNLTFESEDLEKTYDELKAKGVEFLSPPAEAFWGKYVMMKDSEGNVFCIGQSHKL